jgi:hypothetical protein
MDNALKMSLIGFVLGTMAIPGWAADYGIKLTTQDGSTKFSIQNSASSEVASVDSSGNATFTKITQTGSGGSYVLNQNTLQSGATFYVSSGTVVNLNTNTLKFADGSTLSSAGSIGTITSVTAGTGLTGGGSSGAVTLNIAPNSTNYIQNTSTLQSGATFYVSSATVTNLNANTLKFADGSTLSSAGSIGTITGVTAGTGLTGGGASGNVTLNLASGGTNYIQNTAALQSGATFYVSSGTATNFNTTTLKFADGTTQTTAGGGAGTITGVTAGVGLTGGGVSGSVTLNLASGGTNYIQNTSTLQSGATFYVSSGSVSGPLSAKHFIGGSAAATVSSTLDAGASLSGSDAAGIITITPGALANVTLGAVVATVTFNASYVSAPYVVITPASLNAAGETMFVQTTTSNFTLNAGVAFTSVAGAYKWYYVVIQ